ncbi:MAG: hypothetical protein ABW085_08850 [Sedimenticola sp.]
MEVKEFIKVLSQLYLRKDVSGIINSINEYKSQPGFQLIYRKLLKSNLISESSSSMDGVIKALLKEISQSNEISRERHTVDNFFETGERLKAQYSKALADIYLETQFPSDFIVNARKSEESGAELRLTDSLVTQYKDELIRIKKGLTAIIRALQPFSNFPIKNCLALNDELTLVFAELRTNYKYLLIKPYLLKIIEVGSSESTDLSNIDKEIRADGYTVSLFQQYINRGEEPELIRQVDLHLAIKRLFIYIKKNDLMDEDELREYWLPILSILNYKSKYELTPQDEDILINLLRQVNKDYSALLHKLSLTFVDEYHASQDLMKSRYRMIRNELIYTIEYLGRINRNKEDFNPMHAAKIELAKDKLFFLQDIFTVTDSQLSKAANVNLLELEKAAFGITTEITPIQLKEWIRIYSIIFSNASYVRHSDEKIDFTEMRELISHLTTYHLIQNITQLKGIIDRNLVASDEERENRFKLFNEALKLRLQGLISTSKSKDKSFQEMIEELGFIQNKKVQFVIADTFKGFQTIADAFNDSANDYFVEDREAIIKESRTLYNDICNQCLKGLVARPKTEQELEAETEESHSPMEKKSWFSRLFAT